jgi:hypothetical protein
MSCERIRRRFVIPAAKMVRDLTSGSGRCRGKPITPCLGGASLRSRWHGPGVEVARTPFEDLNGAPRSIAALDRFEIQILQDARLLLLLKILRHCARARFRESI